MTSTTIVLLLAAATAMAGLPQAVVMPAPEAPAHSQPAKPAASPRGPADPYVALEQLNPVERANARIHIEPGTTGAADALREIERLWNSGDHEAALTEFRNLAGRIDLRNTFVGINWRTPAPTLPTDDWGPNVRVGNRDSIYCTAFDRNSVNGNLLVGLLRHAGTQTYIDVNLSTDGGTTWTETFDGSWSGVTPPSDLDGACVGTAFLVAYIFPDLNQVACVKIDAATGQWIQFPGGDWVDTVFTPAPAQVTEISMCAAEEQWPGQRAYAFGRTDADSLLYAWTTGDGQPWNRYNTTIDWCNAGMIDCVVNTGYPPGGNWLWASWMYRRAGDTLHPAIAWMDEGGTWHAVYIGNLPTQTYSTSSLAAWHDTVFMAYTHQLGGGFYTQALVTYNAGGTWYYTNVPDTLAGRENPDVTGTHGDGLALVHREYGADRAIMYTHSDYGAAGWSPQDTVSDHSPAWIERPRIQWVAPGVYGVVYVSWVSNPYNSVWYNRTDWTGIAERTPARPALLGLRALSGKDGVRLAFENTVPGPVSISIFDAAGRLARRENLMLDAGNHTLGYSNPTAGIYFAQVQAAGKTATAKFFIAR